MPGGLWQWFYLGIGADTVVKAAGIKNKGMATYTIAEENYLKAIYKLSNDGSVTVSTNSLAEALNTSPASITDMLRKLAVKNIINYVKYKGVTLTEEGRKTAIQLIRRHRLWEVFLVQKLKFNWDEVHIVAEELEHVNSDLLIRRLDQYLGFPQLDPHGDPIPAEDGTMRKQEQLLLSSLSINASGVVSGLKTSQPLFLQYLDKVGIYLGAKIKVKDKIPFDNSLEVTLDNNTQVLISKEVSENILISV